MDHSHRREELGRRLQDMLKQKEYAKAAVLQAEIKSLEQTDDVDRMQAARKLELQQQLEEKLAQRDYAGAATIQDEIKSLDQADAMLKYKAAHKQELSLQIDEKRARKDAMPLGACAANPSSQVAPRAAMIMRGQPGGSEHLARAAAGDGVGPSVSRASRKEELGRQLQDMLKQKDYAKAALLQDEIKSLEQIDDVDHMQAARKFCLLYTSDAADE